MKTCKLCSKFRYGNSSWCFRHLKLREREKREAKKLKKTKTKKYQLSVYKKTYKKAWKVFSEFIRREKANFQGMVECYTCLKLVHWKQAHAGHRYHGKLDFDRRNIRVQCCECNTYKHGNLGAYERRLIEEYGLDFTKQLERDAAQSGKYTLEQLQEIIKIFNLCTK